jgi:hypothetical protein
VEEIKKMVYPTYQELSEATKGRKFDIIKTWPQQPTRTYLDVPGLFIPEHGYDIGFNSKTEFNYFKGACANDKVGKITAHIDKNNILDRIEYNLVTPESNRPEFYMLGTRPIEYKNGYFYYANKKAFVDANLLSESKTRFKFFDFGNSERKDVVIVSDATANYNPITDKFEILNTDFLPSVYSIVPLEKNEDGTGIYNKIAKVLEEGHTYIIENDKIINRLTSGKPYKSERLSMEQTFSDFQNIVPKVTRANTTPIDPPLASLPNEFNKPEVKEELEELLTTESVKKIIRLLQYEVRLQARQTREGRGVGKYLGEKSVEDNKRSQMRFKISEPRKGAFSGTLFLYNPRRKESKPLKLIHFAEEDNQHRIVPSDTNILFVHETRAVESFKEIGDWAKFSPKIFRDILKGVKEELRTIKTVYRTKGPLDMSKFSDKMQNSFQNKVKEIVENALFGTVSLTRRQGRRMKVMKNMLKSASNLKIFGETAMRNTDPLKKFSEYTKEDVQEFNSHFETQIWNGPDLNFEDTTVGIKFNYRIWSPQNIGNTTRGAGRKLQSIEGEDKFYFEVKNILRPDTRGTSSYGSDPYNLTVGYLVISYFYENNTVDKIQATTLAIKRDSRDWGATDTEDPFLASKEISIEYPFDDLGVFMYEFMTGFRSIDRSEARKPGEGDVRAFGRPGIQSPVTQATANFAGNIINETDFVYSNLKYNMIRNAWTGSAVGRNGINKMYYYVMPDHTITKVGDPGQVCFGFVDLTFFRTAEGFRGLEKQSRVNMEGVKQMNFETFKEIYSIGLSVNPQGMCIKLQEGTPRGDTIGSLILLYMTGKKYNPAFTHPDFKQEKITQPTTTGVLPVAWDPPPDPKTGKKRRGLSAGSGMHRADEKVQIQMLLVNKFGQEYLDFIDGLTKKAFETGEIRITPDTVTEGINAPSSDYKKKDESGPLAHLVHQSKNYRESQEKKGKAGGFERLGDLFGPDPIGEPDYIDDGPDDEDDP